MDICMKMNACLTALIFLSAVDVGNAQAPPAATPRNLLVQADMPVNNPLIGAGRAVAAVAAQANKSVVHIESKHEGRRGEVEETGSGVLVTTPRFRDPFVVTNRHVVAGAPLDSISILLADGRVIYPTEKLEDPESDVAVLKVKNPDAPAIEFGDSDNLDIGHFVLAMGSPFGLSQSVTLGIISAKARRSLQLPGNRKVINQDFLQTDAAINPGNSGGPLIDMNGRVVGINTAIASQGGGNEGIGFSIPSNLVRYIAEQLLLDGRVKRGYLGVVLDEEFTIETARELSLSRLTGARVIQVYEGTPAAKAGLRPNDVILDFDGTEVEDETDLIHRVSLTPVNKQVRLIILRAGQRLTLQITLSERERNQSALPPEQIPKSETFRNSSLQVLTLDSGLAVQSGYGPSQRGLLVTQVPEGESQLKLYDIIMEVGRQPVDSADVFDALAAKSDSLLLKVRRVVDGQETELLVNWRQLSKSSD
ncbi:MAG: trypsin-like peptidase domain-containing protein [Planctomycetaceae bacterium]|nr:trypsin-like peptidase domain-containing protein [Planctomycetaceae bacterium]MCB9952629.1 trypsin-like peptidase domain-containing protein [Planctomycetaceae bacterium]